MTLALSSIEHVCHIAGGCPPCPQDQYRANQTSCICFGGTSWHKMQWFTSIVISYQDLILELCFWVDSKHILGLIDSRNLSLWRPIDRPWRLWTYSHINVYNVCRSLGGISGSSKKSSLAAVIGAVVAVVVALSLIAFLLFCLWRRRRSKFDPKHDYFHKGRDGKVPKLSIIMWESTHKSKRMQTSLYQSWSLGGWAFRMTWLNGGSWE